MSKIRICRRGEAAYRPRLVEISRHYEISCLDINNACCDKCPEMNEFYCCWQASADNNYRANFETNVFSAISTAATENNISKSKYTRRKSITILKNSERA